MSSLFVTLPHLSWPNPETPSQIFLEICLPIILNPVKLTVDRVYHILILRLICEAFLLPDLPNHPRGRTFDLAAKKPAVCPCHHTKYLIFSQWHPLSQIFSLRWPNSSITASWNWPPVHWLPSLLLLLLPVLLGQIPARHGGTPSLLPSCPHSLYFHVFSSTQLSHILVLSYWIRPYPVKHIKQSPRPCLFILIHDQPIQGNPDAVCHS